jgi:predicted nuclease of predicted toxin-antitoxin system
MNLSPAWVDVLQQHGHDAVHWGEIGRPDSKDDSILSWASDNERAVFTADLDFGMMVVTGKLAAPSVIQLRLSNLDPQEAGALVNDVLNREAARLVDGAVLTIETQRARLRPGPASMEVEDNG